MEKYVFLYFFISKQSSERTKKTSYKTQEKGSKSKNRVMNDFFFFHLDFFKNTKEYSDEDYKVFQKIVNTIMLYFKKKICKNFTLSYISSHPPTDDAKL